MPYKVITGSYHVANASPDGDSLKFIADDPSHYLALSGPKLDSRPGKREQLRLEGIDALETHYGALHQPVELAREAIVLLLDYFGIRDVVWNADHSLIVSASDGVRGYILSRSIEKNRRPVAFAYVGDAPEPDGSDFFLTPEHLRGSYNYRALESGLAYATFYWSLFADLRGELTGATLAARAARRGLYAVDATNEPFKVDTLADLTDRLVILPKLFRRLSDYFREKNTAIGFKQALELAREPVVEAATTNFTHFDSFIDQAPGSPILRLTIAPEGLIFDPMPQRPTNLFAALVAEEIEPEAVAEMFG